MYQYEEKWLLKKTFGCKWLVKLKKHDQWVPTVDHGIYAASPTSQAFNLREYRSHFNLILLSTGFSLLSAEICYMAFKDWWSLLSTFKLVNKRLKDVFLQWFSPEWLEIFFSTKIYHQGNGHITPSVLSGSICVSVSWDFGPTCTCVSLAVPL